MAQQFDYPKTETQLREIQDKLYQHSKEARDAGDRPAFKGLLEIMSAEVTIITAIHNIKSNHGSETPGVDSKTMDYQTMGIKTHPISIHTGTKPIRRYAEENASDTRLSCQIRRRLCYHH